MCIRVDDATYANSAPGWDKDETATYDEDCILGIESVDSISLVIYPNPASEVIDIIAQTPVENVLVYDIQGRLVLREESKDIISISGLARGTYFAQIDLGDDRKVIKRFIKD